MCEIDNVSYNSNTNFLKLKENDAYSEVLISFKLNIKVIVCKVLKIEVLISMFDKSIRIINGYATFLSKNLLLINWIKIKK